MRKNISLSRLASLSLFAAAFIWGTSFVIMKDVSERLPPSFLLGIRFTVACLLLAVISWKRLKKLNKSYIGPGILIGALLFSAYLVQTYGLIGTTPGKNAFLTASYCIITPFLFWIVSKKRPDVFHLISAFVCLGGILLISVDFTSENLFSVALGDILTLICGFFYAAHIVAIATTAGDKDPMLITILQFGVAAVLSWISYGILHTLGMASFSMEGADIASLSVQLLYLACACTAAALFLQNFGQKYAHPTGASVILTFEAVFGALFSLLLGREEGFGILRAFGFVLVFAAVIISETKLSFLRKRKNKSIQKGDLS
ncbi:MAG: DMT family transporter [Clostridia bacterium]|nr:DMT family transporter [Clostridia bacterium]